MTAEESTKRLADVASDTIKEASEVAEKASERIEVDAYGVGDLVKTFTAFANVAVTGGLKLTAAALAERPQRPNEKMFVLADNLATIAQRALKHVTTVVEDVGPKVADNPMRNSTWVKAATKLSDIAMVSAVEAVETVVIGPANYAEPSFVSKSFTMDGEKSGTLVAKGFMRSGTNTEILPDRITFTPPTLTPGVRRFQIAIDETGLPSGVYIGKVELVDPKSNTTAAETSAAVRL